MKKKYYIHILFSLSFLTVSSCKSQTVAKLQNGGKDSVSYEIITDSVYAKHLDKYYYFQLLNVKHPNKVVQDSINKFIIENDASLRDLETQNINSYSLYFNRLKKLVSDNYKGKGYIRGAGVFGVAIKYNVALNQQKIFGITSRHLYRGASKNSIESFEFNLTTGSKFIKKEVFNDRIANLLDNLSLRILNSIKSELKSLKNDNNYLSDKDKKSYEMEYYNYIKSKEYQITELPQFHIVKTPERSGVKENNTLEIEFRIYKDGRVSYFADPYDSVFYTMKELEPYFTENFKSLIKLTH